MVHHALQIVESDPPSNLISFNEDILRLILTADEIKNRFVSVVSITGAARQGKSFLLNFFLRYLRIRYLEKRDVSEWLNPEDGPLGGFSWVPGSRRHTTGIMMWSEIFLTTLDSGEEVAIILLDTQGAFDNQSSMNDCAKIFALSTLISSTQIYNVMHSIKQYDLGHLECFGGYSRLMKDTETPFQNLHFLVRDWRCSYEHSYGKIGGTDYLKEIFSSNEAEVQNQVENIENLFEKISCFLMPHPGSVVDRSETFRGELNEIDDEFKQHVQDFTVMLLSPENLVLKTINGEKVTAEDLRIYIREYSKIMQDDTMPRIHSIFKATVEAQYRVVTSAALRHFKKRMMDDFYSAENYFPEHNLDEIYVKHKEAAISEFTNARKIRSDASFDKYLGELKSEMEAEYGTYRAINEKNRRSVEDENRRREQEYRLKVEELRIAAENNRRKFEQWGQIIKEVAGAFASVSIVTAYTILRLNRSR